MSYVAMAVLMAREAKSGEMVLTLGAGNISQLGPQILEVLENRAEQKPNHELHKVRTKDFV